MRVEKHPTGMTQNRSFMVAKKWKFRFGYGSAGLWIAFREPS
jgi:hypothetical protein